MSASPRATAGCRRRAVSCSWAASSTRNPTRSARASARTASRRWMPSRSTAGPRWSAVRRFTISPERITGDRVAFDAAETRHLVRVLRLRPGDLVIAADGRGHAYRVRILALGAMATGTIIGGAPAADESALAISLVQGVPKGDQMEVVIRATTELGVARILPALTARTVVRLDAEIGR